MSAKPSVLFVCIHNAGRSQMAEDAVRPIRDEIKQRVLALIASLDVPTAQS